MIIHVNTRLLGRTRVVSAPVPIPTPQPDPAPTSDAATMRSDAAPPAAAPTLDEAHRAAAFVDSRRCYWYDRNVAYDRRVVASDARSASSAFTAARTRGQCERAAWAYIHRRISSHNLGVDTEPHFDPLVYAEISDYLLGRHSTDRIRGFNAPPPRLYSSHLCQYTTVSTARHHPSPLLGASSLLKL